MLTSFRAALAVLLLATLTFVPCARAETAAVIDQRVDEALANFSKQVGGARKLMQEAAGVLVFPKVYKAGLIVGGEYGEGALRIRGRTVEYYTTAAASLGLQLGAQKKTIILLFMRRDVLERLRNSKGWKVGVDASVTLVDVGAGGSMDSAQLNKPILGFVLGRAGLMYNLTLEGSKITKFSPRRN